MGKVAWGTYTKWLGHSPWHLSAFIMAVPTILLVGPLLIGALLNYFLFGIYIAQFYHYLNGYANSDKKYIVSLVYFVTFIEVLHLIFSTHTVFENLCRRFGNPAALADSPWSGIGLPSLNGAVAACVQCFFAWRIYVLAKGLPERLFSALIVMLALGQFAASLAISIQFSLIGHHVELLTSLNRTVTTWLVGSFVCDLLITVGVVAGLMKRREETPFESSRSILNTLMFYTIENGAVTTICALAELIAFQRWSENWVHITFEYMLGRLYANVLLTTLNARESLRNKAVTVEHITSNHRMKPTGSAFRPGRRWNGMGDGNKNHEPTHINVAMSQEVQVDRDSVVSIDPSEMSRKGRLHASDSDTS